MAMALLDTVLERVPVGVLVVDADLRVVRANAALCVLAGGDEAGLVGRRLADVAPWIPEADARRVLDSGTTEEIELADAGRPGRFVVDLQPLAGAVGELGEPYHRGKAGAFARAAKTATGAGAVLGALAGRRRVVGRLAAGLVLGGAVAERFAVFRAGSQSAEDPRYVVMSQRGRR